MKLKSLFVFLLLFSSNTFGQPIEKIDSLVSLLSKTKDSDKRAGLFIQLSIVYDATDLIQSFDYARKALVEAEKKKTPLVLSETYNNLANVYEYRSVTDSSLIYHQKALALRLKSGNLTKIGDSYNNIGIAYDKLGDFSRSLENYFRALRNYEKENALEKQAMVLSNIGIVYKAQGEYEKTLEYYKKANRIYHDLNSDFGMAVSEGNIGGLLLLLKKYNESMAYSERAKNLYKKIDYERYAAYPLINIAVAFDSLKNYSKAEQLYLEAIELNKKYQNTYETANTLKAYGSIQLRQKKYNESINILQEALDYAKSSDAILLEVEIRKILAKAYAKTNNFNEAYNQMKYYSIGRDSLFNEEKTRTVFELETKYQTEKKEKEILIQKAQLAENQLKIERKNQWLYGLGFLAILVGLTGYSVYRTQKLKNKQLQKENELKDALIKIETQNKIQEERLRISRDLHDNIGSQLTFIISSLDNLRFQLNKENPEAGKRLEDINQFTRNTITELRDTIWAMNKDSIRFSDLQVRINNFIENAKMATPGIRFQVVMSDQIDESHEFTAFEGINIYRVIQESIHNSIKHSNATEIKVRFDKESDHFTIQVSDNGKGFDETNLDLGNGINNMHKRIAEIGGELSLNSQPGNGTVLKITV